MSQNLVGTNTTMYEAPSLISVRYNYWRFRLTYTLIVGYAAFYIVRQNFTLVKTSDKCPFSTEAIGWAFSAFSIIYGLFKFIAGAACDRSSSRFFMPIGLACEAVCSFIAGCSTSPVLFGLLYAVSACFQSMGWPSVSRTLTQWFGPRQLGTRWGSIWLWERLRDTPESIGLPSLEEHEGLVAESSKVLDPDEPRESFMKVFREHILFNYRLWMVCIANFFVYFVRAGLATWGPVLIVKTQQTSIMQAGCKIAGLEAGGLIGGLFVGWFTDRFMPKRRGICGAYMMILLGIVIGVYSLLNTYVQDPQWLSIIKRPVVDYLFWGIVGFLVYGPQTLGGLSGAEFGSKKAAAAAAGLTGTVGYAAASVAGIGLAVLGETFGWSCLYPTFVVSSFLGGVFFALTLKSKRYANN